MKFLKYVLKIINFKLNTLVYFFICKCVNVIGENVMRWLFLVCYTYGDKIKSKVFLSFVLNSRCDFLGGAVKFQFDLLVEPLDVHFGFGRVEHVECDLLWLFHHHRLLLLLRSALSLLLRLLDLGDLSNGHTGILKGLLLKGRANLRSVLDKKKQKKQYNNNSYFIIVKSNELIKKSSCRI